jgi:tight adherence protein C
VDPQHGEFGLMMNTLWDIPAEYLAIAWGLAVILLLTALIVAVVSRHQENVRESRMNLIRQFSGVVARRVGMNGDSEDLMGFLLRVSTSKKALERLELSLSMAGFTGSRPLYLVRVLKLAGFAVGGVVMLFGASSTLMPLPMGIVVWLLMYFGPDLWLQNQISQRTKRIGWQLPEALDLLHLCVRAGLGFTSGLQEVARTQKGAVSAEFSRVLQEMQFGTARVDAFSALAERTKQPDLIRFSHAMVRADQAGITVSEMLAEQARSMREQRSSMAREKAQQISVKILFPLMTCFLPGVFIVVLGPAAINAMTTLSQ